NQFEKFLRQDAKTQRKPPSYFSELGSLCAFARAISRSQDNDPLPFPGCQPRQVSAILPGNRKSKNRQPNYLITFSARIITTGGIVRPTEIHCRVKGRRIKATYNKDLFETSLVRPWRGADRRGSFLLVI